MIIACPSCGRPLDKTHLKGRSLKCSACKSQYLYQNGIVVDPIKRFFPSRITWEDLIGKIFSKAIENNNSDIVNKIKVLERKEYYEPFTEIVDKERRTSLVDIGINRSQCVMPISDVKKFKQHESSTQGVSQMQVISQDETYLDKLTSDHPYVDSSIMYVGMQEVSFSIDGTTYKCFSYGDELAIEGGDLDAISGKGSDFTVLIWIANTLIFIFFLYVIGGAWKMFCGSYYHFHGLNIIFMANGFKCFLPFLGVSFLILLGALTLSSIITGLVKSEDHNDLTFVQYRIKQSILKKFEI